MGINYFVTDKEDRHIMTAPMFTLYRVFNLHPVTVERIEKETARLTDRCILVFKTMEEGQRDWDVLQIRRLPIEIPSEPTPASEADDPKTFLRENLP